MTREEKCELAIEKGYTYNPETGLVYNKFNKKIGHLLNGIRNNGYVRFYIFVNKKPYNLYAHQFAWYWVYKECVDCLDHINGIKHDNKISNLRSITLQQNHWNRKEAKGCTFILKKQQWKAQININKKCVYLGYYKTEQEAQKIYLQAKEKYHAI